MSGRERVRLTEEQRVLAPLAVFLGLEETVNDDGPRVEASLPITDWLEDDDGSLPDGVLSVLCDTVLGSAIHVTLEPRESMATSWLWLSGSPRPRPSGRLHARAHLVQRVNDTAVSNAEVRDNTGGLVAIAGCRVLINESAGAGPPGPIPERQVLPSESPWQRRPRRVLPLACLPHQDGLSRLLQLEGLDGSLGHQSEFMGLRLTAVAAGMVSCSMPASAWFTSAAGTVQGGACAWLGLAACRAAATSQLAVDEKCHITDYSAAYLRPVFPSGGHLRAEAKVHRRGRRVIVVSATVFDDESNAVLLITASTAVSKSEDAGVDQTGHR